VVAAHEAGLGTAGQLHDLDAVGLLELEVLLDESGAVDEVMKRSAGRSDFVTGTGRASSMLITVGMPTQTVTRWSRSQSKRRACENLRASTSVAPVSIVGPIERICGEDQLKWR
jgi:hypothetical protein